MKALIKFFYAIYLAISCVYLIVFSSSFICFLFFKEDYKHISEANIWSSNEYLLQQAELLGYALFFTFALFVLYKKNKNSLYKTAYYLLYLSIILKLYNGISIWKASGFDHSF